MALALNKLGTRAITALVFVLILLAGLLWSYAAFTLLFFVIALWGLVEFYKVAEMYGAAPIKKLGIVSGIVCYSSFVHFSYFFPGQILLHNMFMKVIFFLPFLVFAGAVFSKHARPFTSALYTLAGVIYAVLPFALIHDLVFLEGADDLKLQFEPHLLLGVILLIWCNDTFAYLGGSIFGKHKLLERVSPGKTWEGTLFGLLCTFGGSFVIAHFIGELILHFWLVAGFLIPVLATLGDLTQSTMKREANLKDTGSILPGHGGILDRFDSLIFVGPFMVVLVKLLT